MAETIDIRELNERIERQSSFVTNLTAGMDQIIVGQKHLVESLLIGLLSDGHVLLEGVPGLAKTLAIKTLASLIDAQYSRVQFTPDLLPADVIGTMVYSQKDETFQVKKGPVFANFVLATGMFPYQWLPDVPASLPAKHSVPWPEHGLFHLPERSWQKQVPSLLGTFHAESGYRLSEDGRRKTDYPPEYQWR